MALESCLRDDQADYRLVPAKAITSGRHRKLVTFVASRKNGVSIGCESLLEADFCIHLEYLPNVMTYQAQPFTITFAESSLRYTPDFLATLADGSQVVWEVKSDAGGRDLRWQNRRAAIQALFSRNGINFEYVEQHQFHDPITMHNLHVLYHHGYCGRLSRAPALQKLLQRQPHQSDSLANLIELGVSQADLACAIFHRQVFCDLKSPLNRHSQVWCRS